jgi:hypothetical protein
MQLNSVVHFYLGCRCMNSWFTKEHEMYNNGWRLNGVDYDHPKPYTLTTEGKETRTDSVILILLPLSSMTEEEKSEAILLNGGNVPKVKLLDKFLRLVGEQPAFTSEAFCYLIKKGFDLFGLIPTNQAIDSTKL